MGSGLEGVGWAVEGAMERGEGAKETGEQAVPDWEAGAMDSAEVMGWAVGVLAGLGLEAGVMANSSWNSEHIGGSKCH